MKFLFVIVAALLLIAGGPNGILDTLHYFSRRRAGLVRPKLLAESPGQIAYRKDEWIGEMTGELLPPNTYKDSKWVVEFERDDPPAVFQLSCERHGNCFGLLNHDYRPSTRLLPLEASGWWRMGIQAKQDIFDGSEISISYGRNFFGEVCHC